MAKITEMIDRLRADLAGPCKRCAGDCKNQPFPTMACWRTDIQKQLEGLERALEKKEQP